MLKARALVGLGILLLAACQTAQSVHVSGVQSASPAGNSAAPARQSSGDWLNYHNDLAHEGVGPSTPAVDTLQPGWTAPLDGEVYGEPLVSGDLVIAVTENDTVYGLDLASGSVRWSQHIGDPVPLSQLPCGGIDPSGITSTPVIDPASGTLYVVGRIQPIHHELMALDVATGSILFHRTVDPPGADPRYLQERGALAFANGLVYVPYGGNLGDCGPYRGWVIGSPTSTDGDLLTYVVPTQREAGIWASSGVLVDGDGTLLIATGNGASTNAFDSANATIRLSPDLQVLDQWAPSDWAALSRSDTDIGSISPALLDNDQVFQTGKNGRGYLLQASNLGGIGGELFSAPICGGSFGGTAYQSPWLYVPCRNGLVGIQIGAGSFNVAWRVQGGELNTPIVAYGWVWTINYPSAELWQLDPTSGGVHQKYALGSGISAHFTTPTASQGMIFAPAGHQIVAFSGG